MERSTSGETFAFDVVLDYGHYDPTDPDAPPGRWTARADRFSTYDAGSSAARTGCAAVS